MIKRLLIRVRKNKLFFTFIIAIFSVTVLICSASFCLWYMNIKNILHGYLSETIELQQIDAVTSLSAMERSLNKTTYQILDFKSVHNIITGTRTAYADYSDAGSAVQNLMSAYTGLQSVFIINEKNMQIFNQDLHSTPLTPIDDYMQPEAIIEKYNSGSRIFPAAADDSALICVTHDFRGYLVVYVFEKKLLLNQNRIFKSETQSTGLYYKNELLYASDSSGFPAWLSESDLPADTFLYTRDNYSILTVLAPVTMKKWYSPFMRQMILFSTIILLAGIAAILISAKFFDRVSENYVDTLLSHSRQHHHTAIKATIQKGVRNQYISPADQEFLDDYFQKIQYKELFCMLIQLDRINSILLSSSYKGITDFIQKIKLIFEDHFHRLGTCIMLDLDFDTVGLILALPEVMQDAEITKHISAARADIEKHLSLTVTTVLTDSLTSAKDILYTFSHLNKLKQYRFFTGYNSTITDENEVVASNSTPPSHLSKKIVSALLTGDTDVFQDALDEFFSCARQTSCENAKRWILDLAFALLKHTNIHENSADIISELAQAETLEGQYQTLKKYFIRPGTAEQEKTTLSNENFRQTVLEIIENNYSNMDLNLGYLADQLHISTVYAGKKFKNIFGENFNTYLSAYRIQIAAGLLKADDYKITEIAQLCGFSSVGYFNKNFKKVTNMTPSEYRKNLLA